MTATALDPRRHAYRADLAAETCAAGWTRRGYAGRRAGQVVHSATPLRAPPDAPAAGPPRRCRRAVTVYEEKDGWAWVQLARDGYVGYVPRGRAVGRRSTRRPTA